MSNAVYLTSLEVVAVLSLLDQPFMDVDARHGIHKLVEWYLNEQSETRPLTSGVVLHDLVVCHRLRE